MYSEIKSEVATARAGVGLIKKGKEKSAVRARSRSQKRFRSITIFSRGWEFGLGKLGIYIRGRAIKQEILRLAENWGGIAVAMIGELAEICSGMSYL